MRGIVWFREDLRIQDNLALSSAAKECDDGIIALFIIDQSFWHKHHMALKRIALLEEAIRHLQIQLNKLYIPIIIEEIEITANIPDKILSIMTQHKAAILYYNKQYEIDEIKRDQAVASVLTKNKLKLKAFDDQVILAPGMVVTGQKQFFKVFTAFKRAWYQMIYKHPIQLQKPLKPQMKLSISSSTIPHFLPDQKYKIITHPWQGSEAAAKKQMQYFMQDAIYHYDKGRDIPSITGTSSLSPYFSTGILSPRVAFLAALAANENELDTGNKGALTWMNELIWRDFYKHILFATPRVSMHQPYNEATKQLKWHYDKKQLLAWQKGETGFPIVDAAMRQLNDMGWMHNRLRMITAMFFTKNMFFDWRLGEDYFIRNLIDGDLAANNGGWQWCASTGTDAAPYFRIFNPVTQSERFDPDGSFIRKYCPELSTLNNKGHT